MIHRFSFWLGLLPAFVLAIALPWAGAVRADSGHPAAASLGRTAAAADDPNNARVIVQYRRGAALLAASPRQPLHAATLGKRLALPLSNGRVLGERMQGVLGKGISSAALAARLAAQPDVEWAVVDGRKGINAVPDDPYFGPNQTAVTPVVGQWYLRAPDATIVSATHAVGAWDITTGSSSITVAVLDTGVRFDHPDLAGKLHPGYDFVRSAIENDGSGGTDTDASDPGDWVSTCTSSKSSWHGTQVSGLIGAATNNGLGVAGLGRNVMVLPVRVLGQCGSGYDSDIIAGMLWAGGLSNDTACTSTSTPSSTCNPHPAQVINMSLGGSGSCGSSYQSAITRLVAANVAVVVASGNDSGHAVNSPANCTGAIAVAGVRHAGTKVGYSNVGPQMAIAAPAGNCINVETGSECLYPLMTTINLGTTSVGANGYSDSYNRPSLGTSFATPLVAGTVALMRSLAPAMTPAQIKTALMSSARAFPTTGGTDSTVATCRAPNGQDQLECYCTTSTCGAGMLDTAAAVALAQQTVAVPPTASITVSASAVTAGDSVTLNGGGSTAASGRSIASYAWAITSGGTLASFTGATNAATATLATSAAGSVTVSLTVTDSAGSASTSSSTITVAAAPTAAIGYTSATPTVGDVITLNASASTAAGGRTITGRTWSLQSGSTVATFVGSTGNDTATLKMTGVGSATVVLAVTDSAGATATITQTFTVLPLPVAVISLPTGDSPTVGVSVELASNSSTVGVGRTVSSRQWTITSSGGQASFSGATNGSTATLVTTGSGQVTVSLKITDSAGVVSTASKVITVVAPPVAAIGASTTVPTVGSSVVLDSLSSTAGAGRVIASRQWSIVSGGAYASFTTATNGSTATIAATAAGTVVVGLQVVDSAGAVSTSALAVTVSAVAVVVPAVPPVAVISAASVAPTAGSTVTLDSGSSSVGVGKTIVGRLWSITSGGSLASLSSGSGGVTAELAVTSPGSVTVSLVITDSAGLASTTAQTISVVSAPTSAIAVTSSTASVGSSLTLDGSSSTVASGRTIASRLWTITSGGSYASLSGATDGATATLVATAVGAVTVSLTVTDSAGAITTTSQVVEVQAASTGTTPGSSASDPTSTTSGGGGGALGLGWLAGLAAAVLALGRRPRQGPGSARG